MITVSGLSKSYGSIKAVQNVSFSADSGEILGVLGPNGAGKTTIMKVLTGYHLPDSGSVILSGYSITEQPLEVKQRLGYLPEHVPLYSEQTVYEYLRFIAEVRDIPRRDIPSEIRRVAVACSIEDVINRTIGTLSKGYRQRVGLAQAILHDPEILILDEPTSGLDPNQIQEIRALIQSLGRQKTVILSSHIMQEVEALCDRVLILHKGHEVASGTADEIAQRLRGDDCYRISLRDCTPRRLAEAVRDLHGYREHSICEGASSEHGLVSARITLARSSQHDAGTSGAVLFDWAVRHQLHLTELQPLRLRMEEIFAAVTDDSVHASPDETAGGTE